MLKVGLRSEIVDDRYENIFGKKYKSTRLALNIGQSQAAYVAGMGLSGIQRMERGEITRVLRTSVPDLAKSLGMTVPEFKIKLGIAEWPKTPRKVFVKRGFRVQIPKAALIFLGKYANCQKDNKMRVARVAPGNKHFADTTDMMRIVAVKKFIFFLLTYHTDVDNIYVR